MQLNEYQIKAMTYRLPSADETYALLNLSGEVGELHSLIAKRRRDGATDDSMYHANVAKELGDILWMIAAIASDHEISLNYIAANNIEKLESRKQRNVITGSGDNR